MGCYINPPTMSKEEFLSKYFTSFSASAPIWPARPGHMHVVHIHNGNFTAAGIAFDKKEMKRMIQDVKADRFCGWYQVPIADLMPVSDLASFLKKPGAAGDAE